MANILELKNIVKVFPGRQNFWGQTRGTVDAVRDVSLTVTEGESLSLVGESGCGKTTLARIVMRLLDATQGEVMFSGQNILEARGEDLRHYRKNIQMVFQDPFSSLDPRFNVRRILREPMALDPLAFRHEREQESRIREVMTTVQLKEEMLSRYPHEFSGGERQRIAIARSLVMNPRILILDEAVSSLDVIIQEDILNLLESLQKKFSLTYMFISHNLRVVRKVSHKIAVMSQGRIVELAPTDELLARPLHPYTRELFKAAMEYKAVSLEQDIVIPQNAKLKEKENQHWVMESC